MRQNRADQALEAGMKPLEEVAMLCLRYILDRVHGRNRSSADELEARSGKQQVLKSLLTLTLRHFLPILLCPYGKHRILKAFPSATRIFRQFSIDVSLHPASGLPRGCVASDTLISRNPASSPVAASQVRRRQRQRSGTRHLPTASATPRRCRSLPSPSTHDLRSAPLAATGRADVFGWNGQGP